ncbi:MAG: histidinol-phosphate transaminase [Dehalococcoidia bacterium]
MTSPKDIRSLMLPRLLDMVAYDAIDPPEVLARQAGIPEDQVIKLDGNENLYGASPKVAEALARYGDYHIYSDPQQRRVREALASYAGTTMDRVVAGTGSDELIDLLLRLFVGPGERVIQCVPGFGMYGSFTYLVGGEVVSVPLSESFDIDVGSIREAAQDGGKILFLTSPNNPTGNLISETTIRQLLELNLLVVVDEAYFEFSGSTVAHLVPEYSNLVVLRTFSKWAGLAGMRMGYGIMDTAVADRLLVIKAPYNLTVATEVALLASLEDKELLLSRVRTIVEERDRLFAQLEKMNGLTPLPSHANFILCRMQGGGASRVYQELAARGIFIRYYNNPLLRDYIRLSVGLPHHNRAVVEALQAILSEGV